MCCHPLQGIHIYAAVPLVWVLARSGYACGLLIGWRQSSLLPRLGLCEPGLLDFFLCRKPACAIQYSACADSVQASCSLWFLPETLAFRSQAGLRPSCDPSCLSLRFPHGAPCFVSLASGLLH